MTQRKRFVLETQGGLFSHAELSRRYGVSRQAGYKWLERYELEGRTAYSIDRIGPTSTLMRPTP